MRAGNVVTERPTRIEARIRQPGGAARMLGLAFAASPWRNELFVSVAFGFDLSLARPTGKYSARG